MEPAPGDDGRMMTTMTDPHICRVVSITKEFLDSTGVNAAHRRAAAAAEVCLFAFLDLPVRW